MASTPAEPANLKARIKASYDAIAPAYNAWTVNHSPARIAYLNRLFPLLRPSTDTAAEKPPLRVLELGCGAGRPVTELVLTALAPVHVTANDISTTQLAAARDVLGERGEKVAVQSESAVDSAVDWVEADMMDLAFAPASLDAVLAFYSIIHLPVHEQATLLARIATWLRPGGCLLANFGELPMPAGIVMEHWLREEGWMFWSGAGVEGTLAHLRAAGLDIVVSEIHADDVNANFHWVIARKAEGVDGPEGETKTQ